MPATTARGLDPTPPRPGHRIGVPTNTVRLHVDVDTAHLANPLLATSRLLANEAGALARVTGDEEHFDVVVAIADGAPDTSEAEAEAWVRWAVHNVGIRGQVRRI